MAIVLTTRPATAGRADAVGWDTKPSGSPQVATRDDLDSTYIEFASSTCRPQFIDMAGFDYRFTPDGPNTVPPDHEMHLARVGIRGNVPSGNGANRRVMLTFPGETSAFSPPVTATMLPPATKRDGPWVPAPDGLIWAVPGIQLGLPSSPAVTSTGTVRVHELYLEVDCRAKPTFEIKGFQGGTEIPEGGAFDATNRPRFQFENCQYDGLTARSYNVKLKTPGGTLLWETTGAGQPTSVTAPSPMTYLEPGIYVAEFQISSTIRGTAELLSDAVTYNFSVTYEPIDSEISKVEPNCELGGYVITVEVGDLPPDLPPPSRPEILSASLIGAFDARSFDGMMDSGDSVIAWAADGGDLVLDSTSSTKPVYVTDSLNGMSGVQFESGQTLKGVLADTFTFPHPRTFFYVMHAPPHDDNIFKYLTGTVPQWLELSTWNAPDQWYFGTDGTARLGFSESGYHDSPHIFTFAHQAVSPFARIDMAQVGTTASMTMASGNTLELGNVANIAGPNFIMYELLIYNGSVAAEDVDLIEAYLYEKWFTPPSPSEIPEMTVMRHDLITGGLEPVRGLVNLEPNTNYRIVDYEAPSNHEVAYWLYEGGPDSEIPIGGGTLPTPGYLQDVCTEQMYLRWLLNPSVIASNFCLGPIGELTYNPRAGVFPVIGRADPVVVNDRQESARGTLRFVGQTTTEVNQLRKMLTKDAQPTLLTIHESYMLGKEGQLYFQPLAVREEWLNPDNRIPMHALTVDYVEIAPPAGTAALQPPPVGIKFGAGGWIVWDTDPPTGIPHGDPLDTWQSFQHLLSSGNTFETALYGI